MENTKENLRCYISDQLEFRGLLEALRIQLETNRNRMTEEQVRNWTKIYNLGWMTLGEVEYQLEQAVGLKKLLKQAQKSAIKEKKRAEELAWEVSHLKDRVHLLSRNLDDYFT